MISTKFFLIPSIFIIGFTGCTMDENFNKSIYIMLQQREKRVQYEQNERIGGKNIYLKNSIYDEDQYISFKEYQKKRKQIK